MESRKLEPPTKKILLMSRQKFFCKNFVVD
jgi:hypothetical protein